jgi:hypothetical protein
MIWTKDPTLWQTCYEIGLNKKNQNWKQGFKTFTTFLYEFLGKGCKQDILYIFVTLFFTRKQKKKKKI